jgi:hypothetical protein
MSNANGRDYSWGICDIWYELEHPKIFRVHKTALLKFGLVRFWLGLHMMVVTTKNALATPTRLWASNEDDKGPDSRDTTMYEEVHETFRDFGLERWASILELDS